jgi:hypothetical protein
MRAEALELSDLRKKKTRAAQTDLRFSQREVETQVQISTLSCLLNFI